MTRPGADELCFLDITASHENRGIAARRRAAHGGSLLHAADGRRRRAHGRGHPQAAARRRRQGRRSTPPPCTTAISSARRRRNSAASASSSPSTPSRSAPGDAGKSSPMAAASRPGIDAVDYAQEVVALGAGEILLTSMDRDGTKAGFDIALTRADRRCGHRAGHRLRRRRHARSSRRGHPRRPRHAPCSPPRSSISANSPSREAKELYGRGGLPMRLDWQCAFAIAVEA